MTEVHNVLDKHRQWIGSWETEPLYVSRLTDADIGRTVIYRNHGRAEAGILTNWSPNRVWARYHQGDTAAAAHPSNLVFGVRPLSGPGTDNDW